MSWSGFICRLCDHVLSLHQGGGEQCGGAQMWGSVPSSCCCRMPPTEVSAGGRVTAHTYLVYRPAPKAPEVDPQLADVLARAEQWAML